VTGQFQIEIVLGLQELVCGVIDFRLLVFEKENVRDGILAGGPGNASRQTNPGPQLVEAEAFQS
jgi:hypothetical protein